MITAIGDVMRACYTRGWITTRDGNASLRRSRSKFVYITPSGWRKNLICPELMIRMQIQSDNTLKIPENTKPSGELHMHYLLLKDINQTRAVVHAHPTHVVAAMYRGFDLPTLCTQFPEIFRYTRVGPTVPPLRATSVELGEATAKCLGLVSKEKAGAEKNGSTPGELKYDIVGQANHGICSVASDPWSAFEHMERLDHICEIVLKSGVSPEEIQKKQKLVTM